MYRWLRNIHLWLGLLSSLFLLSYAASSVQMAHNTWFNLKPKVTESTIRLGPAANGEPRAAARELMDVHGFRGELQDVRESPNGFMFQISRPGTVYDAEYLRVSGEVRVRTRRDTFMGTLNRIHQLAGLWHDYGILNVWGALVGLISAGLIILAATGIYLWFKIHTERTVGAILLALSLSYTLPLIALIRLA